MEIWAANSLENFLEAGRAYRVPIVIEPYPEGGFGVRSPLLPELFSEGDTFEEALAHARDALQAVLELYEDLGRVLPPSMIIEAPERQPFGFDLITVPA